MSDAAAPDTTFPDVGLPVEAVLADLDARLARDPDVHGARLFGLVYPTGNPALEDLLAAVNRRYLFHNALNPFKFPEVAALEAEVVGMTGALLHRTGDGGGSMTSGGTESILMSMLVNRERARARGVARPRSSRRSRPTPRTPRPRTTSTWTSCPCRSTTPTAPMSTPRPR